MKQLSLLVVLCLSSAVGAQTPDERRVIDTFLLSGDDAAAQEAALVELLERRPTLARGTSLLMAGLNNVGLPRELGARGKRLAELALARGGDVNGTDRDGAPLLIHYGMFARAAPMEFLLANGARPDVADADGRTALHWLATMGEEGRDAAVVAQAHAAAKLLLARKASANAKDKHGATPLHIAAHNGAKGLVEVLLAGGADLNAVDRRGYSVLGGAMLRVDTKGPTFANEKERAATKQVVELLVAKGAKDVRGE